ncbi:MAG TPA: murein transglycosylase A [Usitatibacter sp.]|nr:murein transglycosylase A [Usitatibacter sp.]
MAFLAGCAAEAPKVEPLACPPAEKPVCPPPPTAPTPPTPPAPPVEYRGHLVAATWQELPNWGREALHPALDAFLKSCTVLAKQDAWKGACAGAETLAADAPERDVAAFFELNFLPWTVVNADDSSTGMVTGYYEPLLHGSRTRTQRYRYPIYGVPRDLLTIDLSSVYPDLKNRRLRGRVEGNRVVPYYSRGDIDQAPAPLAGDEIVWVDDAIDVFFLHIQGSGQVELEGGDRIRVGYADQNGYPFRSLGRKLIDSGEIPPERASMQGIKDWARRHPKRVQAFLNANPSYVFFRVLPNDLSGPLGALGVPLTAQRSIAVDPRVVPLGVPVYLSTTWPNTSDPLERLMVAQDTGGAIAGGVRADFYWGFGDAAGAEAGKMRQSGKMWVLLPKDYVPAGATAPAPAPATATP